MKVKYIWRKLLQTEVVKTSSESFMYKGTTLKQCKSVSLFRKPHWLQVYFLER